jgi:hypothetical protein
LLRHRAPECCHVAVAAYVDAEAGARGDRATRTLRWLRLVYAGEVSGSGFNRARILLAVIRSEQRGGRPWRL